MMLGQYLHTPIIFKRLAKALIRLSVCADWSESLLVAHTTLLEGSCCGSISIASLLIVREKALFSHVLGPLTLIRRTYDCENQPLTNPKQQLSLRSFHRHHINQDIVG